MHPAPSVILFTALNGAGFGLLAFLSLGMLDIFGMNAFIWYFIGYALAVGGLLMSIFHLANKKNAIKSFSQWRSSWLSREGVLAVLALSVIAIEAVARIFYNTSFSIVGWIGALLAWITVYATSMIYAQLKTVPRWNSWLTSALFLAFSATAGAMLTGYTLFALFGLLVLLVLQVAHWVRGDYAFAAGGNTIENATGLGRIGKVRLLEPPHSGENYLLHEMAYRIGRKHAYTLRILVLILAFIFPALVIALIGWSQKIAIAAIISHLVGTIASRWLFFAEAQHVVSLYYDR